MTLEERVTLMEGAYSVQNTRFDLFRKALERMKERHKEQDKEIKHLRATINAQQLEIESLWHRREKGL
jgi:endonuclease III-like uncharacterized protein